ncbi:MAG: secretin N-terminal domain-containing protein [Aureliella sp.]|jgi:type II secretory pathway component GspD/PulD (secretin)
MKKYTLTVAILFVLVTPIALSRYPVAAQSASTATEIAAAKKEGATRQESELKLFSLKHAEAETLTQTVQPLFENTSESPMIMVFDKRTNTIIARGPASELQILEVVLMRLDEPSNQDQ